MQFSQAKNRGIQIVPPGPVTHRDAVAVENEPEVGDVHSPHCWLVKGVSAHHLVLLQHDDFPRVEGREGQVGRGIGGELGCRLKRERETTECSEFFLIRTPEND